MLAISISARAASESSSVVSKVKAPLLETTSRLGEVKCRAIAVGFSATGRASTA